ncbi:unnamed protein product [Auanema sp. JU1783]|nr:unnamed protein product [Auanema sp. JU1783]
MNNASTSKDVVAFEALHNHDENGYRNNNGIVDVNLLKKQNALEAVRIGLKELKVRKYPENKLKIKLSYRGEKRCVMVHRPARFQSLEEHVKKTFQMNLAIYYKPDVDSVLVCLRTQEDLDNAIKDIDCKKLTSLHLVLSQQSSTESNRNLSKPNTSPTFITNIVEVPFSETCSLCSAVKQSSGYSATNGSLGGPSGSQINSDDDVLLKAPFRWKKGREIGKGAYGSVYIAHDVDTGRDLAVKVIPSIPLNREVADPAKSLECDVKQLAELGHSRIVKYLGVEHKVHEIFIFMEYMPGGSVKDLIAIEGELNENVALRYTRQILQGLAYLHSKKIVHRDIKPANILRDINGNVKIGDLGTSKKVQAALLNGKANEGMVGTVLYIAPEVLKGVSTYGSETDIWSMGITLIEMLTGKAPWAGLESMETMNKIVYEETPLDFCENKDILSLLKQVLTKSPMDRPTADEILSNHPLFK